MLYNISVRSGMQAGKESFLFFPGFDARFQSLSGTASNKSCVRMAQSVSETNRLAFNSFIMNGWKAVREAVF